MNANMEYIYMSKKQRKEMLDNLGVKASTLSSALHFRSNSLLSRRLRSQSVNFYHGFYV